MADIEKCLYEFVGTAAIALVLPDSSTLSVRYLPFADATPCTSQSPGLCRGRPVAPTRHA